MSLDMLVAETHAIVTQLRADFDETRKSDVAWKDEQRKLLWGGNGLKLGLIPLVQKIEQDYANHVITANQGFKRLDDLELAIAVVRTYVTTRQAAEESRRRFFTELLKVGGTRTVQVVVAGTFGGVALNALLSVGRALEWWH